MKKLFSVILALTMVFCLSACKKAVDSGDCNLVEIEFYTRENSSGYHKEYKYVYEYDEKGNVIKKTEYSKGLFGRFSVREKQFDTEFTYDQNGNISIEKVRTEDFCTSFTDGHNVYNESYKYIYNEKQQLIKKEMIRENVREYDWCGYSYKYDQNGNCIKEFEVYGDGTELPMYENTYDSQNKLIKKRYIISPINFNTSSVQSDTEYTYDADGKLVYSKTISYSSYGNDTSKTNYYYDEFGRLIKQECTSVDADGNVKSKYVNEYSKFVKIQAENK